MKRTSLAAILSVAVALTSFGSAPAQADEDVAKILAAIAGIAIISQIAKRNKETATQQQSYNSRTSASHHHHSGYRSDHSHDSKYKKKRKHNHGKKIGHRTAPKKCQYEQWTHQGTRNVYGAQCLERNAKAYVPRECLRQVRTRNGIRKFYSAYCLRQNGWRA